MTGEDGLLSPVSSSGAGYLVLGVVFFIAPCVHLLILLTILFPVVYKHSG